MLHFKGVRPEQNDAGCAVPPDRALYATQLFGPLNENRFRPGQAAQKTGGMLWRAWLNVEAELITSYVVYLLRFADYESSIKRINNELKRSRAGWIDEELEKRFKASIAFRRLMRNKA